MSATATASHPLRDRQFLRYLAGQSISELGDQVWYIALSWTAVRIASPATAGILLTLSALPQIALLLFGGVIADRFDIRRLMIGSDTLQAVVSFAGAGLALMQPGVAELASLTLIYGAVSAIFMPASAAMQPRLLDPEQYGAGSAAAGLLGRVALTVGAPLGGVLVAVGGLSLALAVDGVTFVVSVATLATVRPRPLAPREDSSPAAGSDYLRDFRQGARFLFSHPVLAPLTVVNVVGNLGFVGPMNIGLAELSRVRGWHATGIGLLLAGFGIGAGISALAMLRWRVRRNAGIWIVGLSVVCGCALILLGAARSLPLALAATVIVGLAIGPMAVTASVLTQRFTPDELRGRTSSFNLVTAYGTVPVAQVLTGSLIGAIGVTPTFAASGAVEMLTLLSLLGPGFRRAEAC